MGGGADHAKNASSVTIPAAAIPPTTSADAAKRKQDALGDQLHVNVAFWGGVVPGNVKELPGLQRFGVPGCKCFTCHSGVDEFPRSTRADLELAMPVLRELVRRTGESAG